MRRSMFVEGVPPEPRASVVEERTRQGFAFETAADLVARRPPQSPCSEYFCTQEHRIALLHGLPSSAMAPFFVRTR